jgi:hypothetical protein
VVSLCRPGGRNEIGRDIAANADGSKKPKSGQAMQLTLFDLIPKVCDGIQPLANRTQDCGQLAKQTSCDVSPLVGVACCSIADLVFVGKPCVISKRLVQVPASTRAGSVVKPNKGKGAPGHTAAAAQNIKGKGPALVSKPAASANRVDARKAKSAGVANKLDSTAPAVRRGKERATPKKKRVSTLRRIILKACAESWVCRALFRSDRDCGFAGVNGWLLKLCKSWSDPTQGLCNGEKKKKSMHMEKYMACLSSAGPHAAASAAKRGGGHITRQATRHF